jgi:hypothetical protein
LSAAEAAESAAEATAGAAARAARATPGRYLIDGRSGSGKSELATAIAADWPELQLVRLDDLYPGWDGLAQGSAMVAGLLTTARWRSWDWSTDAPGSWRELDPSRPILVEGMGAISRASRPLANAALWIDLDAPSRKARALARDGALYAPHWDRWAAQEDALIARENPAALADEVVPGPDAAEHAARWRARLRAARVDP